MSPNQIVAWNLQHFRKVRGWSQDETASRLEPYLGYKMSRQALWEWENSISGKKIHRFDADEITALARVLEVPIGVLFGPPSFFKDSVVVNGKPGIAKANVRSTPLTTLEMLGMALPKRDERLQRAAEEVYLGRWLKAAADAVLRYLTQDRALAEQVSFELFRMIGSKEATEAAASKSASAFLQKIAPLYKRFCIEQQQILEHPSTPHRQADFARKVLEHMKSQPGLLKHDVDQLSRRGFKHIAQSEKKLGTK